MTPALLLELREERAQEMEMYALPIDKAVCTFVNMNRDPGEKDKDGRVVRAAAEITLLEKFRTGFSLRFHALAAKLTGPKSSPLPERDFSLLGAYADKEQFDAWAGSKLGATFVPFKED